MGVLSHSVVSNSATPWTVAHQAPLSMKFSRQGYWSGLPFPIPGELPDPGIKPVSLHLLHCRQILYPHASWEAQGFRKLLLTFTILEFVEMSLLLLDGAPGLPNWGAS